MLEHPSDRCSCSAQVVRAHLAPPGRTVIDSRHRCEVRTRPSILGPMRPIVEFWGSRAWQWPNALAPFLNGDAPSRVAVAYTSGHCINVSQYLTRSTSPRGVPTEFCMLAVRLAVANAAPCDKDASGEVARSQCVLNCPSSPLRQSRVSPRSVSTLRWPVAVCWHSAGQIRGRKGARARLQRADLAPARPAVTSQGGCHRCNCLPGPAGERTRSMSIVSIVLTVS